MAELKKYADNCEDCRDPITGAVAEEICQERRVDGICPQLPVIDKIMLKLDWLAESLLLDIHPADLCGIENPTKEDVLAAAERRACHE